MGQAVPDDGDSVAQLKGCAFLIVEPAVKCARAQLPDLVFVPRPVTLHRPEHGDYGVRRYARSGQRTE